MVDLLVDSERCLGFVIVEDAHELGFLRKRTESGQYVASIVLTFVLKSQIK